MSASHLIRESIAAVILGIVAACALIVLASPLVMIGALIVRGAR